MMGDNEDFIDNDENQDDCDDHDHDDCDDHGHDCDGQVFEQNGVRGFLCASHDQR